MADAVQLVIKVLGKSMDTTLSPEKVELCTLSRSEATGKVSKTCCNMLRTRVHGLSNWRSVVRICSIVCYGSCLLTVFMHRGPEFGSLKGVYIVCALKLNQLKWFFYQFNIEPVWLPDLCRMNAIALLVAHLCNYSPSSLKVIP